MLRVPAVLTSPTNQHFQRIAPNLFARELFDLFQPNPIDRNFLCLVVPQSPKDPFPQTLSITAAWLA
jgi:hypothetical protein